MANSKTAPKTGSKTGRTKKKHFKRNPVAKLNALRNEALPPVESPIELELETELAVEPSDTDEIHVSFEVPNLAAVDTIQVSCEDAVSATPIDKVAPLVDAETAAFERYQQRTMSNAQPPTSTPVSNPASDAISILDLADRINSSPEMRSAATTLAEQTLSRMLFDATDDNRVIVILNGQSLIDYKRGWSVFNSNPNRSTPIPFSTYLSQRLTSCRDHSSDKSIYLRAEHIQQLDKLAGDNFLTATQLVSWIVRAITPVALVNGIEGVEKVIFDPIPSQVYERFAQRCYYGETPVQLMNKVTSEALMKEVGLW